MKMYEYCAKVSFLGMTNSGKTTLINRIVNNSFDYCYQPTMKKEY